MSMGARTCAHTWAREKREWKYFTFTINITIHPSIIGGSLIICAAIAQLQDGLQTEHIISLRIYLYSLFLSLSHFLFSFNRKIMDFIFTFSSFCSPASSTSIRLEYVSSVCFTHYVSASGWLDTLILATLSATLECFDQIFNHKITLKFICFLCCHVLVKREIDFSEILSEFGMCGVV